MADVLAVQHPCVAECILSLYDLLVEISDWRLQVLNKSELSFTQSVQQTAANTEKITSSKGSFVEGAGGIIPWLLKQQGGVKQA